MPGPGVPGLRFEAFRPDPAQSPLRSDVAGFLGRTRRGPVGQPVRVGSLAEVQAIFGPGRSDLWLPAAVEGYFANGGDVAWILRVDGPEATAAWTRWEPAAAPGGTTPGAPPGGAQRARERAAAWLPYRALLFRARSAAPLPEGCPTPQGVAPPFTWPPSPGSWGNEIELAFTFRRLGAAADARLSMGLRVSLRGRLVERADGLDPARLAEQITSRSRFVEAAWDVDSGSPSPAGPAPRWAEWRDDGARGFPSLRLHSGADGAPALEQWLAALDSLADVPEVAIVVAPGVCAELPPGEVRDLWTCAIDRAGATKDRMVLVELPREADAHDALAAVSDLRGGLPESGVRLELPVWEAALYHPWLVVRDPYGGAREPTRAVPPTGHVAGVISRLDRERGAHHSPANAPVLGVLDLDRPVLDSEHSLFLPGGVNPLRCLPGRGVQIWGARTLADRELEPSRAFLAHRRLVHRLVRAIRRVADPLVFDPNGPLLWLAFVRAVTTVLLEAWRGGALAGARPEEAFRVRCDEGTNPSQEVENGRCVCEIQLAPAIPMEFITIRAVLTADGLLELAG